MTITLTDFIQQLFSNPVLFVTVILTLSVILVNGWTDAPNAIATCVSTRAMTPRAAIMMAAIFNFLGVLLMTSLNATVAMTIYNIADFGGNSADALVLSCCPWPLWSGPPQHGSLGFLPVRAMLIAGISGAAIALHGSFKGIHDQEWMKVIYGLLLSTVLGFAVGWLVVKFTGYLFRRFDRQKTDQVFKYAQIAGGAAMAFMHGAQDGQKFMGVFLLGVFLANGVGTVESFQIPYGL
ncbi:MAG: anion permease [Bianqueaceae bacterium]